MASLRRAGTWSWRYRGRCCYVETPIGRPISAGLQVLAGSEAGGEVELGPPLLGVRLARCHLPWVNLAVTQVPPRGHTCPGNQGVPAALLSAAASLAGKSLHGAGSLHVRLPWVLRTLGLTLSTLCNTFKAPLTYACFLVGSRSLSLKPRAGARSARLPGRPPVRHRGGPRVHRRPSTRCGHSCQPS